MGKRIRHITKEDIWKANEQMERHSKFVIRETQMKTNKTLLCIFLTDKIFK
jgi:hypothetical protein